MDRAGIERLPFSTSSARDRFINARSPKAHDDTHPAVTTVILRPETLAYLRNVGDLTVNNEVFALLNFGHLDFVHSMDG